MPDLLAGRVQMNFAPLSAGMGFAKDGKLRNLGCIASARDAALFEVPTFADAGLAAVAVPKWQSVFAPPKTPAAVIAQLSAEIARALLDPELRANCERQRF